MAKGFDVGLAVQRSELTDQLVAVALVFQGETASGPFQIRQSFDPAGAAQMAGILEKVAFSIRAEIAKGQN